MDLKKYIIDKSNNWTINIKVIPNSQNNDFVWLLGENILKFKIKGVPENWKVNKELQNFISKELTIPKNNIKILSWKTSRNKLLKIDFS